LSDPVETPREIQVPDIGSDEKVEVVEVLVSVGGTVAVDDGLVTLESDKATMDVPSPFAGKVAKILVVAGDQVGQGDPLVLLAIAEGETAGDGTSPASPAPSPTSDAAPATEPSAQAGEEPLASGEEVAAAKSAPASEPHARAAVTNGDVHAEVLVIGSGPGGAAAAYRAADLGKKVVLVERYPVLGGVCLNVGCIPSKSLLHVARVIEEAADLKAHGVAFGKPKLDLEKLRGFKNQAVEKLTSGLATMAKQRKVQVIEGVGRFSGAHELSVVTAEGSLTITFDHAIIAAGSRVVEIPGIPYDDPRVMDSTGALELRDVPERLLVVGGGIIGLEMATVYASLGSQITVVELLPHLVPGCDRDLVRPLERRLTKRFGAALLTGTKVARIEAKKKELVAYFEGEGAPESAPFDRVLVAVGRRPNGDRLDAEAAGVKVDERGFIPVDEQQRTNVPHIFAIGDIVGQPMLAHKASHEGKVAAEVAAGGKVAFVARVIPSVAYTDPEIAWVGLTETEAKERGIDYELGRFPWGASGRAVGMGAPEGVTKILFDPKSRRVLGAGVVGVHAGDLISELALAIEMDCEAADIGLTVHPHPTLSETIAFAAEAFEGTVTDIYLPKRKRKS
jgi:dihydrolipoamide dehydrogenase